MALAAMIFLVLIGGGLITVIYGPSTMITSLPCLFVGALTIGLLFLLLEFLERWAGED